MSTPFPSGARVEHFGALVAVVADATGQPLPEPVARERAESDGPYRLRVTETAWEGEALRARVEQRCGDNGASDHRAWSATFEVDGEIVAPGVRVQVRGGGMGATELHAFTVEADAPLEDALTARLVAAIGQ